MTRTRERNRREFLYAAGAVAVGATVAGCVTGDDSSDDEADGNGDGNGDGDENETESDENGSAGDATEDPENATDDLEGVQDGEGEVTEYEDLDEALSAVPFEVQVPEPPEGFEFELAIVVESPEGTEIVFAFTRDEDVAYAGAKDWTPGAMGERTELGGVEGTLARLEDTLVFQWPCADLHYTAGGTVTEAEVATMVESVDCA